jgi:uroporphyrinogen III methyltransferase/synthase
VTGIVYLVGAGPGDPGLLTRRGAELLSRADVVVYDRLIDPEVLDLAPHARRVYAGKRPGDSGRQEEINRILVDEARAGRTVVRLKGGDPFLFGRGGEECEALRAQGISYEVVPGVSAATAAPAYAGIPVTHRDHASWVAIATGYEDASKPASAIDWTAVASAGTGVFLMALQTAGEIAGRLMAAGRDPATPATIVAAATLPGQTVVRSTLADIASDVEAAGITSSATLIVGDVAGLGERLDWMSERPLLGMRVFVPRPAARNLALSAALREAGAVCLEVPAVRIAPPDDDAPLRAAMSRLIAGGYAWIVLASANGVDAVSRALRDARADARALAGTRVAAVGRVTADALSSIGIAADLVPGEYTAAELARELGSPAARSRGRARRVLLPRPAEAPDDLPRALARAGWRPDAVVAYQTVEDKTFLDRGRAELDEGVDAILFTSGSSVRGFVRLWGTPSPPALVCCIGPSTAAAAGEEGIAVDVVSDEHTSEGLVHALIEAVRR